MIVKHYPWHEQSWQQLMSANKANRLHHGLLLVDKDGRGLLDFAQALAAKLLCEADEATACGKCKACLLYQNSNHPDYLFVQPEEEGKAIKVDQVRSVIDFFALTSHANQNKVVVIEPADAMNRNAANGLLKILEEPPENSVIILVTNNDAMLPITIRSRCQKISLSQQINLQSMHDWLNTQIENENIDELLQVLDYAPLAIVDADSSTTINTRKELCQDLRALFDQRINAGEIARKWSDNNIELIVSRLWLIFSDMATALE